MMTLVKAVLTVVLSLVATGCGPQPAPVSRAPAPPTARLPTASTTAPPATSALLDASDLCVERGQIVPGALVAIAGDTVPRRGPGAEYDVTQAVVVGSAEPSKPYQLAAGDRLVVEEGPLQVAGVEWFLVYSADDRGTVSVGTMVPTSRAWVPAVDGGTPLLELLNDDTLHCHFSAAGGGGSIVLDIQSAGCSPGAACQPASLAWAAVAPSSGPCRLLVTTADTETVVVDESVVDWSTGGSWWPPSHSRLVVHTDCTWSLRRVEG